MGGKGSVAFRWASEVPGGEGAGGGKRSPPGGLSHVPDSVHAISLPSGTRQCAGPFKHSVHSVKVVVSGEKRVVSGMHRVYMGRTQGDGEGGLGQSRHIRLVTWFFAGKDRPSDHISLLHTATGAWQRAKPMHTSFYLLFFVLTSSDRFLGRSHSRRAPQPPSRPPLSLPPNQPAHLFLLTKAFLRATCRRLQSCQATLIWTRGHRFLHLWTRMRPWTIG